MHAKGMTVKAANLQAPACRKCKHLLPGSMGSSQISHGQLRPGKLVQSFCPNGVKKGSGDSAPLLAFIGVNMIRAN